LGRKLSFHHIGYTKLGFRIEPDKTEESTFSTSNLTSEISENTIY